MLPEMKSKWMNEGNASSFLMVVAQCLLPGPDWSKLLSGARFPDNSFSSSYVFLAVSGHRGIIKWELLPENFIIGLLVQALGA